MRDVLAVAGVIVVALGLGGTAAYMSVDLTPPGLDLIRPQKPAVVAQIKRVEHQRAVQAEASGCKYCSDIAELAQMFSRRAETARTHAVALKAALPQVSDETELAASRLEELKQAQIAAERADEAASVLTGWASRCTAEDFCKIPVQATQAACASESDPRADATMLIALAVRKVAQSCASAACPSVDCQSSASLRTDLTQIERALDGVGGLSSASSDQTAMASLPVGPSTLKAELKRINDEAGYVARMLPLLLDTKKKNSQLPKLAPAMIDERAVSASTLATVMEQAAQVSDGAKTTDPRYEAAWRLKSLAANMAALGRDARAGGTINWEEAADSMGAAFMDLARLEAMLDRVGKATPVGAGCDTTAASAAQQLREASAMLDLCRMRSACVGRGGATMRVKAVTGPSNVFERAQATADALAVADLGENELIQVADASARPAIDVLRSRGVCRRAGQLREAKAAAPEASVAVAEAVTPALSPATGVVSPQDLVSGAMQAAIDAPAAPEGETITTAVVEEIARYSSAAPRFKPRRMQAGDADVVRVAAPRRGATPDLTPAYQGVVLPEAGAPGAAFGGAGGPTRTTPPTESVPPEQQ